MLVNYARWPLRRRVRGLGVILRACVYRLGFLGRRRRGFDSTRYLLVGGLGGDGGGGGRGTLKCGGRF